MHRFVFQMELSHQTEAKDAMEFLNEFWDMEKSPYLKELSIRGKDVHFHYVQTNNTYINKYWKPLIEGKTVGEVKRNVKS